MRKSKLALIAAVFAITALSAVVYARAANDSPSSMMRGGMMGGGMMGSMSRMMGHCGGMMRGDRGHDRPNEQWRNTPER